MRTATSISLLLNAVRAAPLFQIGMATLEEEIPEVPSSESEVLFRACFSAVLVLLGGVFAGLTIGLMGQDEIYLQVTVETGTPSEQKYAARVLKLLAKGKHWVLVTLLLSNVITNETLPIVLDRLLGGGWPAVVSSTAAIVIFGEIIPQSICVRYGLPLGAYFAPFVQVLMYILAPLAVPTAKLLDYVLGEDHGTMYKKAGLKSLVTLHQSMGIERLNEDEVTIISAVLDLKDKPISNIMTPIEDVFVLASDAILDEKLVEQILLTGFNRIPIHAPNEPANFVGMLLVRTLITYDPEDSLPISAFSLATLPETSPDTSCLNILNYFQEGKSHMVAVSKNPGAVTGVVGVVTLEDVIEELIGEEIVDESDVYVDVHRAIRRVTPAPLLYRKNANKKSGVKPTKAPGSLKPSNKASDPKSTSNRMITIKRTQKADSHSGGDGSGHHHDGTGSGPSESGCVSHEGASSGGAGLHTHSYTNEDRPKGITVEATTIGTLPAAHYNDDRENQSLSQLARSPGNIVTKVNGDIETAGTEQEALEQAMPSSSRQPSREPEESGKPKVLNSDSKNAEPQDEDEARATFSENVVRVNGMSKVVIQEISSSDEGEEGREE